MTRGMSSKQAEKSRHKQPQKCISEHNPLRKRRKLAALQSVMHRVTNTKRVRASHIMHKSSFNDNISILFSQLYIPQLQVKRDLNFATQTFPFSFFISLEFKRNLYVFPLFLFQHQHKFLGCKLHLPSVYRQRYFVQQGLFNLLKLSRVTGNRTCLSKHRFRDLLARSYLFSES